MTNPIAIEVLRNGIVEGVHRGAVAVSDAYGQLRLALGYVEKAVFPRSALKPIQALPLIETGAAKALAVTGEEFALACASHNGEVAHVSVATEWLTRRNLYRNALACGPHWSLVNSVALSMAGEGSEPSAIHSNCSGKHTGMLTTTRHLSLDIEAYEAPDYPVQVRIRDTVSELTDYDLDEAGPVVDGCSAPAYAVPLSGLARAFAQFSHLNSTSSARANGCRQITSAVFEHSFLVAGTERFCTNVIDAGAGRLLVKSVAEGVMAAALPDIGVGVAVKIDDGARRAAETAMTAVLLEIGGLAESTRDLMRKYAVTTIKNWNGQVVGIIRTAPGFPS